MDEDRPKLRLVAPDERASEVDEAPPESSTPPPTPPLPRSSGTDDDRHRLAWMSAAIPLCIGIAILVVGLAVALRLLMDTGGSDDADGDSPAITRPAGPTSSIDPLSLLPRVPTSVGETTTLPAPTVPTTAAPTTVPRNVDPGLIALPVPGGAPAAPASPRPPSPTAGSASVRIFNGFSAGETLDVWEISGPTPVRYGSLPYGGLVEMVAGGRLLPSGVALQLRFVRPGGDPTGTIQDGTSSKTGPWGRNFTPADGSSVTLVLSRNPGLRVVDIDNRRALAAVRSGQVHVVPVVYHLVLEGTRAKQWAGDGLGCLGVLTTDTDAELDVDVGTALRLALVDDPTCSRTVTDALVLGESTAVAVVGLEIPGDRAQLIAVPLG